jgi:hypothetical protein
MRNELLTYLTAQLTGDIKVSQELPWSSGDEVLYLKNMKRLYLDRTNKTTEPIFRVLPPFSGVDREIFTINAYVAVDAKNQPSTLDTVINTIVTAKDINTIVGVQDRECDYETSFEGDVLIYTFTYRFFTIT